MIPQRVQSHTGSGDRRNSLIFHCFSLTRLLHVHVTGEVMQVSEVFLCVAIAVIARVQSQFLYEGGLVENHGFVDRYDMANNARQLSCVTAVSSCCRDSSQGTWIRPDGVPVTSSAVSGVHQVYGNRRIELVVTSRSAMSGIYRCTIQTNDQSSELESYHVGLYPPNEGRKSSFYVF